MDILNFTVCTFMSFLFTVLAYYDSVVIFIEVIANGSVWSTGKHSWLFFPIPSTIVAIATTCSQYLLVLLSLNKYFDFCHPEKAAKYFTMAKVKRYVFLINIFALIINFPHFFEMEYGTLIFHCWACSPIYQYGYLTGFKLLFRWILPSHCLICTNFSVYRKVFNLNFLILNKSGVILEGIFTFAPFSISYLIFSLYILRLSHLYNKFLSKQ